MRHIVISHRRDDVPADARRIRATLAGIFGQANVTLNEDGAQPHRPLSAGDIVVAVIGPRWFDLMRRHSANVERDEVRAEIATALRNGLTVYPVRVGPSGGIPAMPRPEDLPDDIRAIAHRTSRIVATDRLDIDTLALSTALQPITPVAAYARAPGNSSLKLWTWAACIMAATAAVANLSSYLVVAVWQPQVVQSKPQSPPQQMAQPRPPTALQNISGAWSGEGRIRRAIEAALAKGRRPEDARRCQTELITATETGNIVFATASAEIDQRSYQTLDRLAGIIKGCPDFIVDIEGHTDSAGDPANNQRLSERRANAVRDYLERSGVSVRSLTAVGYGETRPVAPNDTPANMARNRRIDFNVTVR